MSTYRELRVWKLGHNLTLQIYQLTNLFPKEEKFGLVSQLRRSASSICANIVEGSARKSRKEFLQYLYQARGSLAETEYHLLLSKDLKFITEQKYNELNDLYIILAKTLNALIASLKIS